MKIRILVVEDEEALGWAVGEKLVKEGYETAHVFTGEDAVERMKKEAFDVVILDYMLPGMDGLKTLEMLREISPDCAVIFVTAYGSNELAWKSLELGADDYINKPFNLRNLSFAVFRLVKSKGIGETDAKKDSEANGNAHGIVYRSRQMDEIMRQLDRYARGGAPVLLTGETGTGKELIAAAIHRSAQNPRKSHPFFCINIASVPDSLIESELFGHAKDAFAGAQVAKKGMLEVASGGTLFLDELSSASPALQGKLLRLIEAGEYYRAGETNARKTDLSIIAGTNKNLAQEVEEGRFRAELYHRLKVLHIEIPPLRDRAEDIEALVNHFLRIFNAETGRKVSVQEDAMEALRAYAWPGNVRELRNTMQNLVIKATKQRIAARDLPDRILTARSRKFDGKFAELKSRILEDFERAYFTSLLREARGNVSEVARNANIDRVYLIRKLKSLGIDPKEYKTT